MVAWWIPVVLTVLDSSIAAGLIKSMTSQHSRTRRIFTQFVFCLIMAAFFGLVTQTLTFSSAMLTVIAVGLLNGIAVLFQWRAMSINMTLNSVFTFLDDAIAMLLSYFILQESRFLNTGIVWGIALSFSAIIASSLYAYSKRANEDAEQMGALLGNVLVYSSIWGVANFSKRYFAVEEMSVASFLLSWYSGTVISTFLLWTLSGEKDTPFSFYDYWIVFRLSFLLIASVGLSYWALQLAPQNIAQPLLLVGDMIIPALIGMFIFHERVQGASLVFMLLALSGGLLIGMNFTH